MIGGVGLPRDEGLERFMWPDNIKQLSRYVRLWMVGGSKVDRGGQIGNIVRVAHATHTHTTPVRRAEGRFTIFSFVLYRQTVIKHMTRGNVGT